MSRLFASGCQSTGASASASVLPNSIQGWFPLGLSGLIVLQSKGLSRVFNTTVQKHQFFSAQHSLWSNSHIHTRLLEKTIALTIQTFVGKVMPLLLPLKFIFKPFVVHWPVVCLGKMTTNEKWKYSKECLANIYYAKPLSKLFTWVVSFKILLTQNCNKTQYYKIGTTVISIFADEGTETQRSLAPWSRSHSEFCCFSAKLYLTLCCPVDYG